MKKLYITLLILFVSAHVAFSQNCRNAICDSASAADSRTDVATTVRPHRMLVKTNAVGWAMGMMNIALEVDMMPHWSFTLPAYYSGWNYFKKTIKLRTTALQPEFRYWLNEGNDGLFFGAHFGMAWYNYASNGDYRYQDHNRSTPALGGGVSVGYRLPLGKEGRWRVEFAIGAGAYSLYYDKFHNTANVKEGLLIGDFKKTFWCMDQAVVSFSYSFDLKKKGGVR